MFKRYAVLAAICVCGLASADTPLEDPMRPYRAADGSPAQAAQPSYRLAAVLISDARRIAVINGKRLRVGQRIDGAELTRIEPKGVELRRGGRPVVLTLRAPGRSADGEERAVQQQDLVEDKVVKNKVAQETPAK